MAANFLAKLNFAFTRPQIYLAVNCWGSQIYKFTHGVTEHTHLQTCKECAATILHVHGLGATCQGHTFEHFPKKKGLDIHAMNAKTQHQIIRYTQNGSSISTNRMLSITSKQCI